MKPTLSKILSAALFTASVNAAAPTLYYNFDGASDPFNDLLGSADVTWGSPGGTDASSPLGDTLGSSFSRPDGGTAHFTAAQASVPIIGTNDFSVSFWINLPDPNAVVGFFDMSNGAAAGGLHTGILANDVLTIGANGGSGWADYNSTAPFTSWGEWAHIAITFDRDGNILFYENGVQLGNPVPCFGGTLSPNKDLHLGVLNDAELRGLMDDFAIYDGALSPTEVANLANGTLSPQDLAADPNAVVTPAALDYGYHDPASGPQDLTVTISNAGASQSLAINSIQVTGADAGFFTVGSFPSSVAPQGSTDVTVTFNPGTVTGAFSATLVVNTNGGNQTIFNQPVSAHKFEPLPSKAALLVVNPHPDDEGLFYGGVLPYYSQVRNLPTVMMSMTSGDSGIGNQPPANRFLREDEMRDAAVVYGVRYEPIFPRFDDGGSSVATVDTWTQFPTTGDDAADYLAPFIGNPVEYTARWIRILRPEILVTSDNGGDYGHADHQHTSAAVVAAYTMAADTNVTILDSEGNPLPAWACTKMYVHDTGFDDPNHLGHLFHNNWEQTYSELGGATPLDIADLGLLEHVSQPIDPRARSYYGPTNWGSEYEASELWTMLHSTVGLDTYNTGELSDDPAFNSHADIHHGDFEENLNLSLFASYLADADGDGDVDGADLTVMLANLGQSVPIGSVSSGDANGDGLVTQADLDILHAATPDTDTDGLPDAWELEHFPSLAASPTADTDGDGFTDLDEFVVGLDPNVADRVNLTSSPTSVNYSVPAASGSGYNGLTRNYQLVYSPDLSDWSTVVASGVADGSALSYPIPTGQNSSFYRLVISIE